MKTSRMNRMLSASALALALALAGCGGGGSSGSVNAPGGGGSGGTTGTEDMNPTLTMTQQAVVDAKEALDAVDTDDDDAVTSAQADYLMAAYDEMMAAREAVAALEEDEERTDAVLREDEAKITYAEAWALKGNKNARAAAKIRADAIGPDGTPPTDRTAAFTVAGGTLTEVSNTDVKFRVSTNSPNARYLGDKFSAAHVWVRSFGKYEDGDLHGQWAIPHTDKEADKPAKFSDYYGTSGEPSGSVTGDTGFTWKAWAPGVSSDGSAITIDSRADADTFKLFDFDFTMDEDDAADGYTFTGAFHGIPGKLTCASGCTAPTFDAMGMLAGISHDWTFTPTATGDALAKLDVAAVKEDAEYLDFGNWGTFAYPELVETRDFGVFAKASVPGVDLRQLVGKAEYKGMASGTYAKKMENPDGMLEPTSYGGFTATAVLTAQFGREDTVAPIAQNAVMGTISDFRDGGDPIDPDWEVTLEWAKFDDIGVIGGTTAGTTKAAGSMTEGEWTGAFLGGDGSGATEEHVMPSAVTGTFDAHFTNGDVAGAFGAHKE